MNPEKLTPLDPGLRWDDDAVSNRAG